MLQRGTTYKSSLLGRAGPVLLGLATIERNGGFRGDSLRTYGGDSPAKLMLGPGDLYVSLKDVTQAGDLLGAVSRVPATVAAGRLTQDTVRLDLVPGAPDGAYLYWLLRAPQYREYCRARATGTTNLSLSREDFLAFPVPPLTDARRSLVVLLESIEAKIELNRRMNRTLESIARAIFKSWFVDFDPVRKKMEGKTGGELGLPPDLAALFPNSLAPSVAGPVPTEWPVLTVGDIASLDKGVSYKGDFLQDHGLPMVNLGCFGPDGRFIVEKLKRYSGDFRIRHTVLPGDIVAANTDVTQKRLVLGRPAIVPQAKSAERLLFSHHVYALRFREDADYLRQFVFFWMQTPLYRERAEGFATGTTVLGLPKEAILECPLLVPPRALVGAFNEVTDALRRLRMARDSEVECLREIRDSLLPKLLAGTGL